MTVGDELAAGEDAQGERRGLGHRHRHPAAAGGGDRVEPRHRHRDEQRDVRMKVVQRLDQEHAVSHLREHVRHDVVVTFDDHARGADADVDLEPGAHRARLLRPWLMTGSSLLARGGRIYLVTGLLTALMLPTMLLAFGIDGWVWDLTLAVVVAAPLGLTLFDQLAEHLTLDDPNSFASPTHPTAGFPDAGACDTVAASLIWERSAARGELTEGKP
ncbi:MAG: hypothetical protein IT385_10680 [Deltaproteobacteria bacterium]|nr:hypothetical protein [Deltaproteobacteria bacterium]